MALSGSFEKYPVSGFGLYCTWSASQSATGNYSDVTVKVYLKYKALTCGARTDATVSINGTSETYSTAAISESSTSQHSKLLKTKTVRVSHNSDGTKTGVALSASWRFDGTYSGTSIGTITASASVSLDAIDRTAPTVSVSASNVSTTGMTIKATSSAKADVWQYSLDNGSSYTQFSTTAGTSASKTLSSLSPNTTYNVRVKARKASNQVYGTSGKLAVKTVGGSVLNSVTGFAVDVTNAQIKLNVTVQNAGYKHDLTIARNGNEFFMLMDLTWPAGTATQTITLTDAQRTTILNEMNDAKSDTFTFILETFDSSNVQIGSSSSKTATISTSAANSAPVFTSFDCYDVNSVTHNVTNDYYTFIQGLSTVTINPGTATAKNGASIASYTMTVGNLSSTMSSASVVNLGTITSKGTVQASVMVTDSRGGTTTVKKNITVQEYAKPKISSIVLRRTNNIEAEIQLIMSGSVSSVTAGGTEKNSLSLLYYRTKLTSNSGYSAYTNILSGASRNGTSFSYSNYSLCSLSQDYSYHFQLLLQDVFGSTTEVYYTYTIPQGKPVVALRKSMVGVNNPNPSEALDVTGNIKASGNLLPGSQVKRGGLAASWKSGRDNALVRTTSAASGTYNPILSAKSYNGSWEWGPYTSDILHMVYVTDSNYNNNTNTATADFYFTTDGAFRSSSLIPANALGVGYGGTGATTAANARTNLGLGNVGTLYSSSSDLSSVAGSTWTSGASVSLPAGSYVITVSAVFASNSGNRNSIGVLVGSTRYNINTSTPNGYALTLSSTAVAKLTSTTTCYVSVLHRSSTAIDITSTTIRAMRII